MKDALPQAREAERQNADISEKSDLKSDGKALKGNKPRYLLPGYWKERHNMMYYKYIDLWVRVLAINSKSIIDIGSSRAPFIERFDWIKSRFALDMHEPYQSKNVHGIHEDFLTWAPTQKFDFTLCLQVLEHVTEARAFASKLLSVSDRVLVSVPYRWPEGSNADHVQDPVDLAKLVSWFGRLPDHHFVVTEPFDRPAKASRLICYFQTPEGSFSLRKAKRLAEVAA